MCDVQLARSKMPGSDWLASSSHDCNVTVYMHYFVPVDNRIYKHSINVNACKALYIYYSEDFNTYNLSQT